MAESKFCGSKERELVSTRCSGLTDSVCCFASLTKITERTETQNVTESLALEDPVTDTVFQNVI